MFSSLGRKKVHADFAGGHLSSDAGGLLLREVDKRLGLTDALGVLLVGASILKGYQLLTEPVANNSIWTYRPFLVLRVELELALGLWLLSGLFAKAAWLASLACFSLFTMITLYIIRC